MNLFTKRNGLKELEIKCMVIKERTWGEMINIHIHKKDNQQGPTVEHRELNIL